MIHQWSHSKAIAALLVIAYVFLMSGNGLVSLTHPDEVFYTQTAKEMLAHHSWLTPMIFDQPHFEKPIFFFWLMTLSIKWFGLNSFSARLMPSLFGILGVLVTYWLAFMLFRNKRLAFFSGVILATSFIYIALSRAVLTDMVFSILVVLALTFFYQGFRQPQRRDWATVMCFVFSALAVLTKGLLGVLFVFVPITVFLWLNKKLSYFRDRATLWGILIFFALTLPWYVYMVRTYGQAFIDEYIVNDHLRRIFEAEHQKSNTFYFYPMTMIGGMFPWGLFLLPAGYWVYRNMRTARGTRDQIIFLLCWIFIIVAGMQIAQSKLASYIFPVFPALAIILGFYFEGVLSQSDFVLGRSMKFFSYLMSILLLSAAVAALAFGSKYIAYLGTMAYPVTFAVLFFICGAAIFIFNRKNHFSKLIGIVASISLILLVGLFLGRHYAEPWVSCEKICAVFKALDRSDAVVLTSKFYTRGVRYYTNRKTAVIDINGEGFFSPHPIPFLKSDGEVIDFLNQQPVTYCIVKQANVKDLQRIAEGKFQLTFYEEIGGKHILKIERI